MKKLHAIALLVATAGTALMATNASAETFSGSGTVNITGSITGANTCTIAVDSGGVLDVGTHNVANLNNPNGDLLAPFKNFHATVNCTSPVATAVKFTSSLPTSTAVAHKFGLINAANGKSVAHVFLDTGGTSPTAGGVAANYSAIGLITMAATNTSSVLTAEPAFSAIRSIAGLPSNVWTIINAAGNPISATTFVYPFRVVVLYEPLASGWKNDIQGNVVSLNNTVTLELYTL